MNRSHVLHFTCSKSNIIFMFSLKASIVTACFWFMFLNEFLFF